MTGNLIAEEIKKYECMLERTKKSGPAEYIPHLENILTELKALQELDRQAE